VPTAFTSAIVTCGSPPLASGLSGLVWHLAVAETLAPVAECPLFRAAYGPAPNRQAAVRDAVAVVIPNLLSFGLGFFLYG